MKVEIDVPVDQIVRSSLIEDYDNVKNDIERIKQKSYLKPLKEFEEQDLKDFKKYRKAFELVIYYYFGYDESKKVLSEDRWKKIGISSINSEVIE